MKTKFILQTFSMLFAVLTAIAQQGINYKAIINDADGDVLVNMPITVQFTILENQSTNVYQETHTPTTDPNGIIIVNIGEGTVVSGVFSEIQWGENPHWLKTEIDKGEGYVDMGTTEFKAVPYALHAKTVETEIPSVTKYSAGDFAQGGVVFWVDETGQHGLVCAKENQSDGVRWFAGTYGNTQATGNGIGSGEANTAIIIAAQVAIGDDDNSYAARICSELLVYQDRRSYGDWYLPSQIELLMMYNRWALINETALANGGTAITGNYHWSSTEVNDQTAVSFSFSAIGEHNSNKGALLIVRAIRAF